MLSRLCLAVLLAASLGRQAVAEEKAHSSAPRTLTTQFTYKASVTDIPAGTKVLEVWLPVPSDSQWQTIRDMKVEGVSQYKLTQEKQYGNRMIYTRTENPQAPYSITVQFVVERKEARVLANRTVSEEKVKQVSRQELARYLKPDAVVPIGGRYMEIAREVTSGKSDKARAVFDHVVASMEYDYKKESPKLGEGDVAFVCDYKKGNCSDLHSYLISLARSLEIPAILEYGFPLSGIPVPDPLPREGKITGYHCWTWIYEPSVGWIPLDASDARRWQDANQPQVRDHLYGNLVLERSAVAFSRGRDITLEPAQKSAPLNNFIYPYAESDGSPVKAAWDLSYRIIDTGKSEANTAATNP